jgi:hypothetical protein
MRLYYKIREDVESVQYSDMSLYPYMCKYFKFLIGHPIIHVGDACADIEACLKKGVLIKSKIVPPKDLYHPVLPYRCTKILLFCLCRTWVLEYNATSERQHLGDADRCLESTWVIDEVRLAVDKGYKILEILEVYEHKVTRSDSEKGEGGLFVDYIVTFFKLKADASGYPNWVRTADDEDRYIVLFYQNECIRLETPSVITRQNVV